MLFKELGFKPKSDSKAYFLFRKEKATTEKNIAKKENLGRRRKSNETNNLAEFLCDIF